jgi:hypothetical protein
MRDLNWLRKGMRVVFKSEPFDLWRTGTIKDPVFSERIAIIIKDSSRSNNVEKAYVHHKDIVGEATERVTPFPFYWGNVLEHLTEEAKENL